MKDAQEELICVLLKHVCALGLISGPVCSRAMDLVCAGAELPDFFQRPAGLEKEAGEYEHTSDTQ